MNTEPSPDDPIPPFLKREKGAPQGPWTPPLTVVLPFQPRPEDPAIATYRAQLEEQKRIRIANRIAKMKARFEPKPSRPMRWNPVTCREEPILTLRELVLQRREKWMNTKPDFSSMTGPQLVDSYGEMLLTWIDLGGDNKFGAVKKFKDRETGSIRCEKIHAAVLEKRAGLPPIENTTEPGGLKVSGPPVNPKTETKQENATMAKKSKTKNSKRYDAEATVKKLVEKNPFREGCKNAVRWSALRSGMSYAAASKATTPSYIRYCVDKRKFLTVE